MRKAIFTFFLGTLLSGCSTWSTSNVDRKNNTKYQATKPDLIRIYPGDLEEKYEKLGEINVAVHKTTLFHPDPTPDLVNQKLKENAAQFGADAVINVKYGTVSISFWSYGTLEGTGTAIKFIDEKSKIP